MTTPTAAQGQHPKPIVKRPSSTKYHTVLSIDGGGLRGIIPTMVLLKLERCIKEHLFENRETLIPGPVRASITSVEDFEIDLADYFDLVAGTSIGSILATYVAARGKGSDEIVNDHRVLQKYGRLRPGSMEAVRVIFHEFGGDIFPQRSILSSVSFIFRSRYSPKGLKKVLAKTFGTTTMSDLETGLLVTSYDLQRNAACSFLRAAGSDSKGYTVRTAHREGPRSSATEGAEGSESGNSIGLEQLGWSPDLAIAEGTNYLLHDITLASASAPTYFPPAKISPVAGGQQSVLVDGGVVANNPTLQALTYAPTAFPVHDVDKIAILSLGCGASDPLASNTTNPGVEWWVRSGKLLDSMQNGTSEYIQAVIDYWLYKTVGMKYGQYTRIQKSAKQDGDLAKLLSSMDNVKFLPRLQQLGEELANANDGALRTFVRDFLFAV